MIGDHAPAGVAGKGGVATALAGLCEEYARQLGPDGIRADVLAIARRLREPLRVGLAGRVSCGKSTLANALVGLPVAPTAAGECTQVVTRYRFAEHDEAAVVLRDGSRKAITLGPDRTLPDKLPAALSEVDSLDVRLYCSPLRDITLIDTPGLSSFNDEVSARTAELLDASSRGAADAADALVYVITRDVKEDDEAVIETFARETKPLRTSAANTVVVLNKADKLVDSGEDPSAVSTRLVRRAHADLGPAVAAVVPAIALLGETSACGRLNEGSARSIRELAAANALSASADTDPRALDRRVRGALAKIRRAHGSESERLIRLLDLHGLRQCLAAAADGRGGAAELTRVCEQSSGMLELRSILFDRFASRAGVLKSDSALAALRALVQKAPADEQLSLSRTLREGGETVALAPEGAELRVVGLAREVAAGAVNLPDDLNADITRWVTGMQTGPRVGLRADAPDAEIHATALAHASRWRVYGNDPRRDPAQRRAASVMSAIYALEAKAIAA